MTIGILSPTAASVRVCFILRPSATHAVIGGIMAPKKTLRTFDLVLFNVVAIVGLRWVALTAHSGPSSLALWVLAAVAC